MRVLLLDDAKEFRGGQRQVAWLARGLAQRGVEVHVAARPGAPLDERLASWNLPRIPWRARFEGDPIAAAQLARWIDRNAIDVLNAQTSHAHTLAWMAASLSSRKPLCIVTRRVDFAPGPGFFQNRKYNLGADTYIAISRAIAGVLNRWGIAADRIDVVHSTVEPVERVEGARAALINEIGATPDSVLIGNVAALVPHKGQTDLIEAFVQCALSDQRLHLVVAGDGPLMPTLRELAAARSVENRVHLLGHRTDLPRLYSAFDIFAMTSREEGLCTSILDAMSAGVPVVGTAAGGIPEIVRDGETGLLAPVGDATGIAQRLVATLADPVAAARRVDAAREMTEREFGVDRMVDGVMAVYERRLAERQRR